MDLPRISSMDLTVTEFEEFKFVKTLQTMSFEKKRKYSGSYKGYETWHKEMNIDWVFVWNNPPSVDAPKDWKGMEYVTWQAEKGKETGTLHVSGLFRIAVPRDRTWLRKYVAKCWFQPMRGTLYEALKYFTKSDTRVDGPWCSLSSSGHIHLMRHVKAVQDGVYDDPGEGATEGVVLPPPEDSTCASSTSLIPLTTTATGSKSLPLAESRPLKTFNIK